VFSSPDKRTSLTQCYGCSSELFVVLQGVIPPRMLPLLYDEANERASHTRITKAWPQNYNVLW